MKPVPLVLYHNAHHIEVRPLWLSWPPNGLGPQYLLEGLSHLGSVS